MSTENTPTPTEVTGSVVLQRPATSIPHQSRAETFERHYERCRESGIPAENARQIANEATDRNHRGWDRNKRDR